MYIGRWKTQWKKSHIHKLVRSEGSLADCTLKTYAPELITYNKGKTPET
jgi:hypothetical protein